MWVVVEEHCLVWRQGDLGKHHSRKVEPRFTAVVNGCVVSPFHLDSLSATLMTWVVFGCCTIFRSYIFKLPIQCEILPVGTPPTPRAASKFKWFVYTMTGCGDFSVELSHACRENNEGSRPVGRVTRVQSQSLLISSLRPSERRARLVDVVRLLVAALQPGEDDAQVLGEGILGLGDCAS